MNALAEQASAEIVAAEAQANRDGTDLQRSLEMFEAKVS
jgi:hypothetical protein